MRDRGSLCVGGGGGVGGRTCRGHVGGEGRGSRMGYIEVVEYHKYAYAVYLFVVAFGCVACFGEGRLCMLL